MLSDDAPKCIVIDEQLDAGSPDLVGSGVAQDLQNVACLGLVQLKGQRSRPQSQRWKMH